MALADLIARLEQDAAARVRASQERADREVREAEAHALRAAGEAAAQRLERRREALAVELQRALSAARGQARARELAAQRALAARVLARAKALIPQFAASAEFRARVPALATEVLAYLDELQPVLRCPPALLPLLEGLRRDGLALVPDEGVGPGVVGEAADGSVRVDNTLEARLRRLEPSLTIELLREVEGGDP